MAVNLSQALANKWLLGSAISFFSILLAFVLSFTTVFENLELKSYDLRFALRGAQRVDSLGVVIVDIDDQSFFDLPHRWPFPRTYYARLIDNLVRAGARLILFDIIFSEPTATNPAEDLALAAAAARSRRVVFAGKKTFELASGGTRTTYLIKPIKALLQSGSPWGIVNIDEDVDGFVRRYLLYEEWEGRQHLPLAMLAYRRLRANGREAAAASNGLPPLPRFDDNSFLINFRGPARTFPTYSFASVLDDRDFQLAEAELDSNYFETVYLPNRVFANKVVFVGASAEELQDVKFTPFYGSGESKHKLPGVEVHANALATLLLGDAVRRTPFWVEWLVLLAAGFGTMTLVLSSRTLTGMLWVGLALLAVLVAALLCFVQLLVWLPVVAPSLAIVLSYVGNNAQLIITERRERWRTKRVFQQYVSESIVNNILASGAMPKFGGEKRELTVLFSDIRGFTTYCEKHTPETVVLRLNEYLTEMTEIIKQQQGTLDKYVGDEIMAVYGAPYAYPNHAEKACETAVAMIDRLRELQKRWSANAQDYFQIGIGINTGPMIVGNLGSQQLFDYTVIGDEVNLGARLEGANKEYWTSIIISESTYAQVKNRARARELDLVRVKGKKRPVKIYELRSMEPLPAIEEDLIIQVYSQGLALYRQGDWVGALQQFKRVLRYFPSDGPSRVYVTRCFNFIESPPPPDWDGVYDFKSK
ncbi:MAG: adenylate/guanylate cyclase domain-containing protein [candidate division KSB1 bacterium]|nr:adenylate/guanylate cyclase domain-containing protein [candidate division KSB1 bacterium]MDZ7275146.1 adenylate/guanylate cyclase domain-containing protein [candidate division KSB1 bacterium]MDZ7287315.1 adenylate/guanylate cyclase domain-containing protein [candidate division KSB1 bacterium]MDZ7299429.1 adenylate/guanylate cyclase domain-containing protein [candidate division KSB1 bacterium]MDZ7308738.1 adenylate/guanylate cyclase domain-containing protein [candidate division KSB1 bacterium